MADMLCPPCSEPMALASCSATSRTRSAICFTSSRTSLASVNSMTWVISSPFLSFFLSSVPAVRTRTDSPITSALFLPRVALSKRATSLFIRRSKRARLLSRLTASIVPTGMPAMVTREWTASPEASFR